MTALIFRASGAVPGAATEEPFATHEEFGVEDMLICLSEYLLTYSAYSRHGVRVALAKQRISSGVSASL